MFRFLTIVVVLWLTSSLTEAKHEKKKLLPSAVVVGSVYCDTCFQLGFSKTSHFISGASVAVECETPGTQPHFHEEVKTNEQGEFAVHLPFTVTKRVKIIKKCSVNLISSSEPNCAVASLAASSTLHLKATTDKIHIFSAGFFTFKPPKQPKLCNRKPNFGKSKKISSKKLGTVTKQQLSLFPNPLQPPSLFPPNPLQPPSLLPPNPLQPPSLLPPNPLQPPSLFPPNPFQPPASILPPNPLLPSPPPSLLPPNPLLPPSPPPSLFPPNPFQPPSPPASIFPPIPNPFMPPSPPPPSLFPPITLPPLLPGLTPSPPPPSPPPPFAIHLPPFPFQPSPGFPGVPPASSSFSENPSP